MAPQDGALPRRADHEHPTEERFEPTGAVRPTGCRAPHSMVALWQEKITEQTPSSRAAVSWWLQRQQDRKEGVSFTHPTAPATLPALPTETTGTLQPDRFPGPARDKWVGTLEEEG